MRPRGTYGEVSKALLDAAKQQPGTVRELAQRACVGFDVARKSASRLKVSGALKPVHEGRPEVLAPATADRSSDTVMIFDARFWLRPSSGSAADGA